MNNCIVVIPIYKNNPKLSEIASFRQGLTVLKRYDVSIFTYAGLDLSVYKNLADEVGKKISVEYFDKHYFESVAGYNELCFKHELYERFLKYEYMLIYQLDAWVFRDELQQWCDKGYDYIGAPIFWAYNDKCFTERVSGIGNGGFSLRRVSYCLRMLNMPRLRPYMKPTRILKMYYHYFRYADKYKSLKKKLFILPLCLVKMFGICNNLNYFMRTKQINEDMMFGTNAKYAWGGKVNLPTEIEAMKFSFEVHPEILYHKIGNRLPFGCHAFEKWSFDSFWSKYIQV